MAPLTWESAGNDEPSDQNAESARFPGWWSLGPDWPTGWTVELIATDDSGQETAESFGLGSFETEAEAKSAAEAWETSGGAW